MNMSNEEYQQYVMAMAKSSPTGKNLVWAFLVGGGICAVGQGLSTLYEMWGAGDKAMPLVSLTWVFIAAFLTGIGVFDDIARHAGAGTLVPITGFSNAMVSPALEFQSEGRITGTGAKLFTVAGPVLAYGVFASVVYGVILMVLGLG